MGEEEGIHWLGGFAMQVTFGCGLLFPAVVLGKIIRSQDTQCLLETTALYVIMHLSSLLFGSCSILLLLFPITFS